MISKEQRIEAMIRDLLGFKDCRYRLVDFPRPQKRRPVCQKTVSDGEVRRPQ
jgi:hypothetical protein